MKPREAAKAIGVNERTVRRAIQRGWITSRRRGRFHDVDLEEARTAILHANRRPIIERFLGQIAINPDTDCWEWTGYIGKTGYGRISRGGQGEGVILAHRFAYMHYVGEIPEGLGLDHLCRVRHCVNPQHLEPVTCRENIQRGHKSRKGGDANGSEYI